MLQAGDVVWLEFGFLPFLWINRKGGVHLALRIHAEEHGAIEAMLPAQNLRQHRHGLLAAILLVGGNEHDVSALARAITTGIDEPLRAFRHRMGEDWRTNQQH